MASETEKQEYKNSLKATSLFGGVQVYNIIITILKSKVVALLLGPGGMGIYGLLTSTSDLSSPVRFDYFGNKLRTGDECSEGHCGGECFGGYEAGVADDYGVPALGVGDRLARDAGVSGSVVILESTDIRE